jgi:hypothetical protein
MWAHQFDPVFHLGRHQAAGSDRGIFIEFTRVVQGTFEDIFSIIRP